MGGALFYASRASGKEQGQKEQKGKNFFHGFVLHKEYVIVPFGIISEK